MTIRVVIADDHAIVRGGLEQLLSTASDLVLVGTATDGDEAVETVAREHPDVVLMDLSMPNVDGVEATRRIVGADPEARVIVLTSFGDDRHIADALDAGAVGYMLKHAGPDELLDAIRAAAAGDSPLDPKAARVLLASRRLGPAARRLSAREEEVLRLVASGLANKQIARRLEISERTVKAHLTNVFAQLGVSDRTQAALWAKEHLPPDEA
jgi:DNA-binding NarL/FixJ family response regulator